MKVNTRIYEIIEALSKLWDDSAREKGNVVKIYIGKDDEGEVTNYIELTNSDSKRIGTGIGGFKIYLEQIGGFCPDIVVNGVLMDEEEKKNIIDAVLDGKYLRLDDED